MIKQLNRRPTRVLSCVALVLALAFTAHADDMPQLALMTYNLRLDLASDGANQWSNRREQIAAQIGFLQPDALGAQEALAHQLDQLQAALPDYEYVGVGRDDANRSGEFSPLFYRRQSTELLDSSTFWLSETPAEPSYGWGATFRRICTYGQFRDKRSGQKYWIFNTHLDHEAEAARMNGVALILERIHQIVPEDEPFFLMGDFNATPESAPIQRILKHMHDSRAVCRGPIFGPEGTFNNFRPDLPLKGRIDYIFVSRRGIQVDAYAAFYSLVDGRFPSDHLPVVIRCRLDATTND